MILVDSIRAALKGESDDSIRLFLFLVLLHLNKISSHWVLTQNKLTRDAQTSFNIDKYAAIYTAMTNKYVNCNDRRAVVLENSSLGTFS